MNLAKRIIAGVGAPALLAGVMLAGSASIKPAVAAPKTLATITFTANVYPGTTTFALTSTSCSLKVKGSPAISCFVSGAGTIKPNGKLSTANLTITSANGPISLSLTNLNTGCGKATTGVAITPAGPVPVTADAEITKPTNASPSTVTGTISVYEPGHELCPRMDS